MPRPLAVTAGEPAGIGPDLCLQLADWTSPWPLEIIGDADVLAARAQQLGIAVSIQPPGTPAAPGVLVVRHVPVVQPVVPGRLNPANAQHVLDLLRLAATGCADGGYAGVVTTPVHKGVINDAGVAFSGHTEYFAELAGVERVVMLLVGGGLRVAVATTHLPLAAVPAALTIADLFTTLRVLQRGLIDRFGLTEPRILVAGLNPHAGEGGHLGREELDIIIPALQQARAAGLLVRGPLPADTLFTPRELQTGDAVLAMFHDQGLPVLKYASFGAGVNVTLGLPWVRTSVDHGTALDLAGSGRAEPGSLFTAIELAAEMAQRQLSAGAA